MTMARIALIGLSYRTSHISIREQLSCATFSNARVAKILELRARANGNDGQVQELVLLSTCNRVELYAGLDAEIDDAEGLLTSLLCEMTGVEPEMISGQTFFHTDRAAANHLLRVAAGLDSLVLGESQVLGQVTSAYMDAVENKTIGPALTELFRCAIRTGKRARSETTISQNSMSTSSMAIAQAHEVLGSSSGHRYLVIGLGEMGRLALKRLYNTDVAQIGVINRTFARTANYVCGETMVAYAWEELIAAMTAADIIVSATAAAHTIITAPMVEKVMAKRPDRPLVLLDVAVPRDIERSVGQIKGVRLYDADQLQGELDQALAARQAEAPHVEQIITEELDALTIQLRALNVRPVIVHLRAKAERIRQEEVGRALHYLGDTDPQTIEQLHLFSRALINKLLHDPTVRLKDRAGKEQADAYAAVVNDLFALDDRTAD